MSEQFEQIKYGELPQSAPDAIVGRIAMHSTVLLRKSARHDWVQAGSGSFVRFRNAVGILTAGHVLDLYDDGDLLGIVVETEEHLFSVPLNHTTRMREYSGQRDGSLPDVAFVGVPPHAIAIIESKKMVFYNLEMRQEQILAAPPDLGIGAWAICGAAGEKTWNEEPVHGSGRIQCFYSQVGLTAVRAMPDDGAWDSLAGSVNYGACSSDTPQSFSGFSGGGLWRIGLRRSPDGTIEPKDFLLCGVACYQSDVSDMKREIVCHGPRGLLRFMSAASGAR